MKNYFFDLKSHLESMIKDDQEFAVYYEGEKSDFCRFNQSRFRQAGSVEQNKLSLKLINGRRHADGDLVLTGRLEEDIVGLKEIIHKLTQILQVIGEDPFLLLPKTIKNTNQEASGAFNSSREICLGISNEAQDLDLVGIIAMGQIFRGFFDSRGQENWFASHNFSFDWSLYHEADKAVKQSYGGVDFDMSVFRSILAKGRSELKVIKNKSMTISPGQYRVYLSPQAVEEIMAVLSWGSFSRRNIETKQSPLLRLSEEKETLHSDFVLAENAGGGSAPLFNSMGFIKPDRVALIDNGKLVGSLTSPRTAEEFSLAEHSGAGEGESPEALVLNPGKIRPNDVLGELDNGLYINNLWYLNYSDRVHCRLTGMTRFATFWVENGEIKAPVNVMRFDDTFYRMFGAGLHGLTDHAELSLSNMTYDSRSTRSFSVPGAIVNDFQFTL